MIEAFFLAQLDLQLLTMHPVELEPLAGLMVLSEKKFPLRSMAPLPGSHAALERASLSVREPTHTPSLRALRKSPSPEALVHEKASLRLPAILGQRRLDVYASTAHRVVLQAPPLP